MVTNNFVTLKDGEQDHRTDQVVIRVLKVKNYLIKKIIDVWEFGLTQTI